MTETPDTTKLPAEQRALMLSEEDSMFFNVALFEQAQRVASIFAGSTMVPTHFQKNIGNCMIGLNYATRLKADPFMVFQCLYVVHGRPGIEGKLVGAAINTSGKYSEPLKYKWLDPDDNEVTRNDVLAADVPSKFGCQAYTTDAKSNEVVTGPKITWELVKNMGWYDKNGPDGSLASNNWRAMPEMMFYYRCDSWFANKNCPEVKLGMPTVEELHDTVSLARQPDGSYAADVPETITSTLLQEEDAVKKEKPEKDEVPVEKLGELEVVHRAYVKTFDERVNKTGIPKEFLNDYLFKRMEALSLPSIEHVKVSVVENKLLENFAKDLEIFAESQAGKALAGEAGDEGDKSEGTDPPPPARLPETLQLPPGDPDWRAMESDAVIALFKRMRNPGEFRILIRSHPEVMYCAESVVNELRAKWVRRTKTGDPFGLRLNLDTFWGTQEEVKPESTVEPPEGEIEYRTTEQQAELDELITTKWKIGWGRFIKFGMATGRVKEVIEEGQTFVKTTRDAAEKILADPELTLEEIVDFFKE